jgi:hypothetical protein
MIKELELAHSNIMDILTAWDTDEVDHKVEGDDFRDLILNALWSVQNILEKVKDQEKMSVESQASLPE